MRKSDLHELLASLDKAERKRFYQFLHSPYFMEAKIAEQQIRLLDYLFVQIDGLNDNLTDEEVFGVVFQNINFVQNKLEKLKSELLGTLRRFFAVEISQAKYAGNQALLLQAEYYLSKGLINHYRRTYKQLEQWVTGQNQAEWLPNQYTNLIEIADLHTRYATWFDYDSWVEAFEKMKQALNLHYGFARFYHSFILQSYLKQKGHDVTAERKEVADIYEWSGFEQFRQTPQGHLIHQIICLQSITEVGEDERKTYDYLRQYLQEQKGQLHPWVVRNLLGALINTIPSNQADYRQLRWPFQKMRAEINLTSPLIKKMHEMEFTSSVNEALYNGELDWAKKFVVQANGCIDSETDPIEAITFAQASIAYAENKCDEALNLIVNGHFTIISLRLSIKILEVAILYDTGNEQLDSRVDALKIFIFREKQISKANKESATNFINILIRLTRPGNIYDVKQLTRILADIHDCKLITRKEWLEKICHAAMEKAARVRK